MHTVNDVFNLLGAIVGLAALAVFFSSPNTSKVVSASGTAFSNAIKAAKG